MNLNSIFAQLKCTKEPTGTYGTTTGLLARTLLPVACNNDAQMPNCYLAYFDTRNSQQYSLNIATFMSKSILSDYVEISGRLYLFNSFVPVLEYAEYLNVSEIYFYITNGALLFRFLNVEFAVLPEYQTLQTYRFLGYNAKFHNYKGALLMLN